MASSPEARAAGEACTTPVEKDSAVSNASAEALSTTQDADANTQADEPASKPAKTSEDGEVEEVEQAEEAGKTEESRCVADAGAANNASIRADKTNTEAPASPPPLPNEPLPTSPPPLPDEPLPDESGQNNASDDGWDPVWSDEHQAWYFVNRFTQQTQWENPRVPDASAAGAVAGAGTAVGGYNPAIHGDYDPNAWYAKGDGAAAAVETSTEGESDAIAAAAAAGAAIIQGETYDAYGHRHGTAGERYSRDAKASRQLNSFFDVAAASGAHDGRSLKAERSGIKPSKSELRAFKERRRARKEEKRRAWLRD